MRLLSFISTILVLSCSQTKTENKSEMGYSKTLLALEKYNTESSIIEGTPTYNNLKNNDFVSVEYVNKDSLTKRLQREHLSFPDSVNYIFTDTTIIISHTGFATDLGKLVDFKKTDSTVLIKSYKIEQADTIDYKIGNEPTIVDNMCKCIVETRIRIKISPADRHKKVIYNEKTIRELTQASPRL